MTIPAAARHLWAFQLCALAFSATLPHPPPQSLSLPSNQVSRLKPAINITLPTPSNDLPDEDYTYHVPYTTIAVRFYHYGDNHGDAIAMQQVLSAAFEDAASRPPLLEIGSAKLQYSKKYINTVDLVLLPEVQMNWQMWRYAILGLGAFMHRWDNVWLGFDVEVVGVRGRVGTGYIFKKFEEG